LILDPHRLVQNAVQTLSQNNRAPREHSSDGRRARRNKIVESVSKKETRIDGS